MHSYTDFGSYPITLVVTNLFGCTNTFNTNEINIFDFTSQVVVDNAFGCTPLTIDVASTNNSLVPVVDWNWTLINYANSPPTEVFGSGENTNLILVDTGRYDIQLITTNQLGCKDTVIYQNDVGVGVPPVVSFSASSDTACVKDNVSFFNNSSSFADEWNWSFGDGGTSAEENPDYEYQGIGPYDVTLEVLHLGEMPPEGEEPLTKDERGALVGWLTAEVGKAAESQRLAGSGSVIRRLNRVEYQNTVRDLLGIDDDYAKDLPPDPVSADGFQNNGAALGISDLQLEYYLQIARKALGRAIVTGP